MVSFLVEALLIGGKKKRTKFLLKLLCLLHFPSHSAYRVQEEIWPEHALCLRFGVSSDPAEFLHLFSGAWRTRGGLHTSATLEVALLCDESQIQQKRGERALTWESVHIPGCQTCLASSPSGFTELKVSGSRCYRLHSSIWNPLPSWLRVTQVPQCLLTVTSTLNCFKIQMLLSHPTAFNGFHWP